MTFSALEQSVESGNVAEFYTFTFGATVTRYTSYNRDITFGGLTYTATQISRSKLQASSEAAVNELEITVTIDNEIAKQFIASVPGQIGTVRVTRAHADDPAEETAPLFDGFIAQVKFDGDLQAIIICKPKTSIFKRAVPRMTYQGLCNHILYDARCKILRSGDPAGNFTYTGNVISSSGNDIDVSGISTNGAQWAIGGFVKAPAGGDADARLVIAQAGDTLTLLLPFSITVLNTAVDVFAGCKHDLTTCQNKFNNVINYGGFPYIPRNNPFNTSLRGGS